jgi:hypothetical protein
MVADHIIDQESREIVAWLSPLNFWPKQVDTLARKQEGTGQWLFVDPAFKEWLNGTDRTLWCPGIRMLVHLENAIVLNLLLIWCQLAQARPFWRMQILWSSVLTATTN